MEQYESVKWKEELDNLLFKNTNKNWEEVLSNFALFFAQHGQPDLAREIWSFICLYGRYNLAAAYNLSAYYLNAAKNATKYGLTAEHPPLDLSKFSQLHPGEFHPDKLIQDLMNRNEKLSQIE